MARNRQRVGGDEELPVSGAEEATGGEFANVEGGGDMPVDGAPAEAAVSLSTETVEPEETTTAGETTIAETAPEDERIVLFYDGEVPHASFPIMTEEGYVYVTATKGHCTAPLAPAIAARLLGSRKGFSVAAPEE